MTDTQTPTKTLAKTPTDLLKEQFYTEQTFTLDDGVTQVTARVNDAVIERVQKYLSVLLELRGLLSLEGMDETYPDVQKKLQARAKGNPEFDRVYKARRQGKNLKGADLELYLGFLNLAVQAVRKAQEPQVQLLLFQAITWSVLYDDLFYFEKGAPVFRLDGIEIPESYWTIGVEVPTSNDPLDALLGKYTHTVQMLPIDRNNPLEWMIALVTTLVSDDYNPKFAKDIQPILQNAAFFISLSQQWRDLTVDEAGFQLEELVRGLQEEMESADSDGVGEKSRRRVRKSAKKAESGESGGQGEGQET